MLRFFSKSLLEKTLTLFIISVISFLVVHLAPGEPSKIDPMNPRFTQEDIEKLRASFDLDKPLHTQYYRFYKKFFSGKLKSFKDNQPVLGKIWERFLNSLPLFILSTILTWTLAFPTGIYSAINRGGKLDRTIVVLVSIFLAVPGFVLAYFLIIFTVKVFNLPVIGMITFGQSDASFFIRMQDRLWHMVLPSLLVALSGIMILSRYVREQMLEVIDQDFIRTAQAKGASQTSVYYRHALRNALLPFITMFGMLIPALIGGSVIIEQIFAWPGMGRMAYEAVLARDYPIIIGLNFIGAFLVLMGTFVSDFLYMAADPRIKFN